MVKKQKSSTAPIEKVLTVAGLALVIVGCISSLYYLYVNRPFINDAMGVLQLFYYMNYLITLGGGFAAGYFLTRGDKKSPKLFNGVVYALLTTLFYFLFSALQFIIRIVFGELTYPWGMLLFSGASLYALIIVTLTAYYLQHQQKQVELNNQIPRIFVVSFLSYELYEIGSNLYYLLAINGDYFHTSPLLIIASYLLNPLVVAIIAYFILGKVKTKLHRLFYASFIGSFSYILMLTLWNFQTDPFIDAAARFQLFSMFLITVITGLIIWKSYRAIK